MKMSKKLMALLFCLCCTASLFALEGVVLSVEGKVEIQDGDSWIPLEEDDIVDAGAVISTGFKSECVIALDETTLTVKALTRLTLEQLFEQDGNKASTMYLDAGSISASVRSEEDKKVAFKVKTPAVTASVRGTDGDVYINRVEGRSGKWLLTAPEPKMSKELIKLLADEAKAILKAERKAKEETPAAEDAGAAEVPEVSESSEATTETAEEPESPVAVPEEQVSQEVPAATEVPAVTDTEELFSSLEIAGGVLVHEGETSTVATTAGGTFALNTPQQTAVEAATSLGSSTTTPSTTESVAASVPQAPVQAAAPAETRKATGSIRVTINWAD